MTKRVLRVFTCAAITGAMLAGACTHKPYVMPDNQRAPALGICFEQDVLPIFQSNCAKSGCHDAASHEEGYALSSYSDIMSRGIVPGNPAASKIFQAITTNKGETFMPQGAPALTAAQISVIRAWIAAGAVQGGSCSSGPCDSVNVTYNATIAPIVQNYCRGCHNSASSAGGDLSSYADVRQAAVHGRLIGDISHSAGYNAMPQGGAKLDDCKIAQFKRWVAAGTPEN